MIVVFGMALALLVGPTGHAKAAVLAVESVSVTPEALFPNRTQVRGKGPVRIQGRAPGATFVQVTVTDDLDPPTMRTLTIPTLEQGSIDFEGALDVSGFGLHRAEAGSFPDNADPELTLPADPSVSPGDVVAFSVAATDTDGDPVRLEAPVLPPGASFEASTGSFVWNTPTSQPGVWHAVFAASDGRGGAAAGSVRIRVGSEQPANSIPVLQVLDRHGTATGVPLALDVAARDPEEQPVTVRPAALPAGAQWDSAAQRIAWTPAEGQEGLHRIVITARDSRGAATVRTVTVTVYRPEMLGASTLTFEFTAGDGSANTSSPVTRRIIKFAATPGDTTPPITVVERSANLAPPPPQWCHAVASKQGACAEVGGSPDRILTSLVALWPLQVVKACIGDACNPNGALVPTLPGANPLIQCVTPGLISGIGQLLGGNPGPLITFSECVARATSPRVIVDDKATPVGEAQIAGYVFDDSNSSLGLSSEIADVVVRVYRGDDSLMFERRSFTRVGTRAYYGVVLRINEFEPNFPAGPPYRWTVAAEDAFGNKAEEESGTFFVHAE